MKALYKLIDNIKSLDEKTILDELYARADVKKYLIYLNTRKQLGQEGVDSDDRPLVPFYATSTIFSKRRKRGVAGVTDHVTLYNTGELYKSWTVERKGNVVIIQSSGRYEGGFNVLQHLRETYGQFEGLTDESIDLFIDFLVPLLIEKVRKRILKGV